MSKERFNKVLGLLKLTLAVKTVNKTLSDLTHPNYREHILS